MVEYQYDEKVFDSKKYVFIKIEGEVYCSVEKYNRVFALYKDTFKNSTIILTLPMGDVNWFIGEEEFEPYQMKMAQTKFQWKAIPG